jgi:glycine cleavage system H protein
MVVEGLYYTKSHEWIKVDREMAFVGITDYAQEQLGEITYVELPPLDKDIDAGDELAVVESSKAASDVYSPMTGRVIDANAELKTRPELINEDCYEAGWICKIEISNENELKELMSPADYEEYLKGL